jgi:23S rRNA U2552 (ribose-2'-O)-methylase RlmE/FtsJ
MERLNEMKGQKKIYLIINEIERYIDDYNEGIGNVSDGYFGLDKKPKILSRAFYKLWELLMCFDLIDPNQKKFVAAHLAEGPGSFIQATMFYREMFGDHSKTDKYYGITLDPESDTESVPPLEKKFTSYYAKEKPIRFVLHETYPKAIADKSKDKDNGDLTDPKTIKHFQDEVEGRADFITADGGFVWEEETIQEQEAYFLVVAQIISAFKVQKKGGNFICKFFETFTNSSMKAIVLLTNLYEEVYFMKPMMSNIHNSEKYIVCLKFKYSENDKEYIDIDKKLDKILSDIRNKPKDLNIVDIFSEFKLNDKENKDLVDAVSNYCVEIANKQFKVLNEINQFLDSQNYHGEVYETHRQHQIDVTKFWLSMYFPDIKNYDKLKKYCSEMKDQSIKHRKEYMDEVNKSLS